MNKQHVGTKLRSKMKRDSVTIRELAEMSGYSESTIKKAMGGDYQDIGVVTITDILQSVGLKLKELL